jgi:iron(III) transport system permease protein
VTATARKRRATGARRAPWALTATAVVVGTVFAVPTLYLLVRTVQLGSFATAVTAPGNAVALARTLVLAVACALTATVLGTALAWLLVRTDVPGRRMWRVLAPLPLVYPSFVGATALIAAFAPGGLLSVVLEPLGVEALPTVDGFVGSWLVITLFTYPLVYLPVAARFAALPASLEESARLLGRRGPHVFRTVVLPQARTAIWAGALLVALYAVSDFGAVDLMGYGALTREIFQSKLVPRVWVPLGLLLALVALAVVALERAAGRHRVTTHSVRARPPALVGLGGWRWPSCLAVAAVLVNALLGPFTVLGFWALRGLLQPAERATALASSVGGLGPPTLNTALVSVVAAVVAVVVVLPVAMLTARYRSRAGGVVNATVVGGFALPGLVVALALGAVVLGWVRPLYQTIPVLILAYTVHFGSQATRSAQVAVGAVPPRLDDAARMLGASRRRRFWSIELPLMRPGLIAGGGLVLLSTMKELPATLLLAPPNFSTLATRIWNASESGQLAQVGVASVLLVLLSGVLTWFIVLRRAEQTM